MTSVNLSVTLDRQDGAWDRDYNSQEYFDLMKFADPIISKIGSKKTIGFDLQSFWD